MPSNTWQQKAEREKLYYYYYRYSLNRRRYKQASINLRVTQTCIPRISWKFKSNWGLYFLWKVIKKKVKTNQ